MRTKITAKAVTTKGNMMPPRSKGFSPYLFLLGLGLLLLLSACGSAPEPLEVPSAAEEPKATASADLPAYNEPTPVPSIKQRSLTLEFPPKIRAGDGDVIRLTLEVDELGNITPTAEIEGHEVVGEIIEFDNLYETHNIIAESRLDMAGMQIVPEQTISEPLLPGESVTFYWSIRAPDEGEYRGTVWLHLLYIPKAGGAELRRPVSAQTINIKATKFFGIISADPARKLGAIGTFLGALLGFPFVDDVLKFLWKKVKK